MEEQRKSIFDVLADVQERIEQPKLNAAVKYGNTNFRYADLSELWRVVRAATKGTGLFVHHDTVKGVDGKVESVAVVFHYGLETFRCAEVPVSLFGKLQDVGSALTYAKRYSLAMAFGLSAEEDDDGKRGSDNGTSKYTDGQIFLNESCRIYAEAKGKTMGDVQRMALEKLKSIPGDKTDAMREKVAVELLSEVVNG